MNKDTLIQLFKAPYKRQAFIDNGLLPTLQGKVGNLKIYDAQGLQPIELTASEQTYAVSAVKYGEFQTLDEIPRTVELYEIIVNDNKQIERSRVGLGALVKKHIIGNNAVLVNFAYQNPEKRTWRFSFIARDGVFQDGEMQIKDTHPKRYTYVFGEPEETYKTALDRFFILGNELEITINKIKDAFGVEAMSKAFFDEYRDVHYTGFVDYLMRSNFKKSAFNGNDKDVRDFVKKLLGRIVFLYFLQKKGWLGAKDTSYKNGDKNFMTNFFKKAGANDAFYANWLSKLFFDALNNERPNDDFIMPDGESVKIPYLNGGLFEKETDKYNYLTFPADLFTNLFEFFDQYNFTIFEDSPEEHTVAVDPEMLGHIFENLLEDNKDKGAFYTPKEIVHYMTQESLIEYLHTQLPDANRTELENFVKNKDNKLSIEHKAAIDQKLDTVKICDPAIGSGAFPMGLLQEIFGLKERIAYDLGYKVWSPATVKENIIQKSIYGVDIERGAVDIARLRFWLSLIVDEEMPKALPNLDYKIVVGNSLVSKFDDTVIEIDWDRKGSVGEADIHVKGVQTALKSISEKQKQFFESKSNKQKAKLKAEIRDLKLDVLINQLSFNKASYLNRNQKVSDMGFGLKATDHKKNLEIDLQVAEFDQALAKLKRIKENPDLDFNHFDWKLDFPEVLNPLVNEVTGFDIVIGNPPYFQLREIDRKLQEEYKKSKYFEFAKGGRLNVYQFFIPFSVIITKSQGITCLITQNSILAEDTAISNRKFIFDHTKPFGFYSFPERDNVKTRAFESAKMSVAISLLQNSKPIVNENFKVIVWKDRLMSSSSTLNTNYSEIVNLYGEKLIIPSANDSTFYFLNKLKSITNKLQFKSQAGEIDMSKFKDDFVLEKQNNIRVYTGAQILRYKTTDKPSQGNVLYLSTRNIPNTPKASYRSKERICMQRITGVDSRLRLIMTILPENSLCANSTNFIGGLSRNELRYCLAVLNSKLINFYFKLTSTNTNITTSEVNAIPIPTNGVNGILPLLVDIILDLNKNGFQIAEKPIIEEIEEVINALVFELYFPEEFAEKGIAIEKYSKDIFNPIEGLKEDQQIKAIREAYQTLREKDNPLRNQIKLMKIELKELLLPILSV